MPYLRYVKSSVQRQLLDVDVGSSGHCDACKQLFAAAGPAPEEPVALSQQLLAKLSTLPEDAQAVSHLFKQGRLPVFHGNLQALEDMTKELVVGSSGKLAEFFSSKVQNGGLLDATGKLLLLAAHTANALFVYKSLILC